MFDWLKPKKPLSNYEVEKTYNFDEESSKVRKGFVNNQTIPSDIFDLNIAVIYYKPKGKEVKIFVISSKKELK